MSISVQELGPIEAPLLLCIPGMIGGPDDFRSIIEGLESRFRILLVDINAERREEGLKNLSEASVNAVDYQGTAKLIQNYLSEKHPGKRANFIGLSIGGKVVYHFAADFPKLFQGAVITDITPGKMEHTQLYGTVIKTVMGLDLNKEWKELKEELNNKIEDRNFRILIKSQLYFPNQSPPAQWRNGMFGLEELLKRNTTDELWVELENVSETLEAQKSQMIVIKASRMSGLAEDDVARLKKFPFVKIIPVENASHFVHITRVDALQSALLMLVSRNP